MQEVERRIGRRPSSESRAAGPSAIVEAQLSEHPVAGASLTLSLRQTRAELAVDRAEVYDAYFMDCGPRSLHLADTREARKKRRQRRDDETPT